MVSIAVIYAQTDQVPWDGGMYNVQTAARSAHHPVDCL
jgi:hypothetical protein